MNRMLRRTASEFHFEYGCLATLWVIDDGYWFLDRLLRPKLTTKMWNYTIFCVIASTIIITENLNHQLDSMQHMNSLTSNFTRNGDKTVFSVAVESNFWNVIEFARYFHCLQFKKPNTICKSHPCQQPIEFIVTSSNEWIKRINCYIIGGILGQCWLIWMI